MGQAAVPVKEYLDPKTTLVVCGLLLDAADAQKRERAREALQ